MQADAAEVGLSSQRGALADVVEAQKQHIEALQQTVRILERYVEDLRRQVAQDGVR